MTEKELQELEAENFLASLATSEDDDNHSHTDLLHLEGSLSHTSPLPDRTARLRKLYNTLNSIDHDLEDQRDSMTSKELIMYRKEISGEIASLEGRVQANDTTKYIPMNVTFNIQNNH